MTAPRPGRPASPVAVVNDARLGNELFSSWADGGYPHSRMSAPQFPFHIPSEFPPKIPGFAKFRLAFVKEKVYGDRSPSGNENPVVAGAAKLMSQKSAYIGIGNGPRFRRNGHHHVSSCAGKTCSLKRPGGENEGVLRRKGISPRRNVFQKKPCSQASTAQEKLVPALWNLLLPDLSRREIHPKIPAKDAFHPPSFKNDSVRALAPLFGLNSKNHRTGSRERTWRRNCPV